jgi:hypothetical protein
VDDKVPRHSVRAERVLDAFETDPGLDVLAIGDIATAANYTVESPPLTSVSYLAFSI